MRGTWLLVVLAGVIGGSSWLPLGLSPLLPVPFFLIFRALRRVDSQRDAIKLGLIFGVVRYAVSSHFLLELLRFSPLAIVFYGLAILYILPSALVESWGSYWLEKRTGFPRTIAFGMLYVLMEKVRTLGDLSFPADLLSNGMAYPAWLGWTALFGPYAITLWVMCVAILLDYSWEFGRARMRPATLVGALALVLWLTPLAVSPLFAPSGEDDLPPLKVAIVQPYAKVEEKADDAHWPALWSRLERLTRRAARNSELIVWPESNRPGPAIWKTGEPFHDERMETLSKEVGVPILYGSDLFRYEKRQGRVVSQRMYNGAALVTPDGASDWYGKQRLLPFAEGVPFADLIGWDPSKRKRDRKQSLLTMLGNFSPGPKATIFEVGSARIGVLICYEGLYPELARRYANEGANTLAVLTNDAWWGHGVFPYWHAQMITARARELGLPVIRAANNGISCVVDREGSRQKQTRLDEITILKTELKPSGARPTYFARHGDFVIPAILIVLSAAFLVGLIKRSGDTT